MFAIIIKNMYQNVFVSNEWLDLLKVLPFNSVSHFFKIVGHITSSKTSITEK